MIVVELEGLEVFGRHGVLDEERRDGQTFLYDVRLEVGDAARSDRIEDAVDYRDVADCVREVSDGRQFNLIEALAAAVADALAERFDVERVRVRVRKPTPAGVPRRLCRGYRRAASDDRNGELVAQSGDLADGASAPGADGRLDVEVSTLLRPVLDAQRSRFVPARSASPRKSRFRAVPPSRTLLVRGPQAPRSTSPPDGWSAIEAARRPGIQTR